MPKQSLKSGPPKGSKRPSKKAKTSSTSIAATPQSESPRPSSSRRDFPLERIPTTPTVLHPPKRRLPNLPEGRSNRSASLNPSGLPAPLKHNQANVKFEQEEPLYRHKPKAFLFKDSRPTPIVDSTRVTQELERLVKAHHPRRNVSLEIYEKQLYGSQPSKLNIYYALEFCLKAMGILSDDGKDLIASYLLRGNPDDGDLARMEVDKKASVDGELIDIQECRRFVTRIGDLLKSSVQHRFSTGFAFGARKKLDDYYDFSSFLTGREDFESRSASVPGLVKDASTAISDELLDGRSSTMYNLSPFLRDEEKSEDFWLFASQITGATELRQRGTMRVPAHTPEEFILLENSIADEMNKFALSIVVEGGMKAAKKAPAARVYEVHYDPDFITVKKSLEHLPEVCFRKPGPYPPSPVLLDLHHRLYRLLHETKVGRAWMKESDWQNSLCLAAPPPQQINEYREYTPESERELEESEGETGPVPQLADCYLTGGQEPFSLDELMSSAEQAALWVRFAEKELDADYTLVKAFETRR